MDKERPQDAELDLERGVAITQRAKALIFYAKELKENNGGDELIDTGLAEFFNFAKACNADQRRNIYRNLSATGDPKSGALTISVLRQRGQDLNLNPEHKRELLSLYERFLEDQIARDGDGDGNSDGNFSLKAEIAWLYYQAHTETAGRRRK
jgi:hypothetical protein